MTSHTRCQNQYLIQFKRIHVTHVAIIVLHPESYPQTSKSGGKSPLLMGRKLEQDPPTYGQPGKGGGEGEMEQGEDRGIQENIIIIWRMRV